MIVFIERYLPIEGTSFHYWATVMNTDETPVTFESTINLLNSKIMEIK